MTKRDDVLCARLLLLRNDAQVLLAKLAATAAAAIAQAASTLLFHQAQCWLFAAIAKHRALSIETGGCCAPARQQRRATWLDNAGQANTNRAQTQTH